MAEKIPNEKYPTPISAVKALVGQLALRPKDKFLEPARGADRAIYDRIYLPEKQKSWAEIEEGVDYLSTKFEKQDVIITNPPFSLTEEFIKKSFSELAEDGTLAYLQRVNFFGTVKRVEFWEEIGFPPKAPILVPRPRFVKIGKSSSDSCEYMWMIWDKGNRFPWIPKGNSNIIAVK